MRLMYDDFTYSFSKYNKWHEDPIGFVMYYLYDLKYPSSQNMIRGINTEYYIAKKLNLLKELDPIIEEDLKKNIDYHQLCLDNFNKCLEENNLVINEKTIYQKQINIQNPELKYPINGYIDLDFENYSIDIKNSSRIPSSYETLCNMEYAKNYPEQLSIYHHFEYKPQYLLYVNDKKYKLIEIPIEDMKKHYKVIIEELKNMERIFENYDKLGWDKIFDFMSPKKSYNYTDEQQLFIKTKIIKY